MKEKLSLNQALRLIDEACWTEDEFGCLNIYVSTLNGEMVHCYLTERPPYCDRGHIQLNIDGDVSLDQQDMFPRYFFTYQEADVHCRAFLRWRLCKIRDGAIVLIRGKALLVER